MSGMNREFLQLAKMYNSKKHGVGGWYVSEKLDGMRAYWDGGISRGMSCSNVPYANTAKDDRLIHVPMATGLWSRYAKPIHAPDWFLDQLPEIPLDGELFLANGEFQELISIVKQHVADERWANVTYCVFDSPSDQMMWVPGRINNPNCKLKITNRIERPNDAALVLPFYKVLNKLDKYIGPGTDNLRVLQQSKLPFGPDVDEFLERELDRVTLAGGEGLMLRKPESVWFPKRSDELLKIKKLYDSEAIVKGYVWGRGKLEGLMGALIVEWYNGQLFELSGFTDDERLMHGTDWGEPGSVERRKGVFNPRFTVGSVVTFHYTEISKDGIPLKARYFRPAVS